MGAPLQPPKVELAAVRLLVVVRAVAANVCRGPRGDGGEENGVCRLQQQDGGPWALVSPCDHQKATLPALTVNAV